MLKRLRLERFKNFKEAELTLGPFTVLIGANASGKSNLRDAFRFLHGIGRGYTLAEIMGEAYVAGALQWTGIRGGNREITFQSAPTFALELELAITDKAGTHDVVYRIEVDAGIGGDAPRVVGERLMVQGNAVPVFEAHPPVKPAKRAAGQLKVQTLRRSGQAAPAGKYRDDTPVLSQLASMAHAPEPSYEPARLALDALRQMRFPDFTPDAMRAPSLPGQTTLGDRGEHLASVLQAICSDPRAKASPADWIEELTPMDARGLEFPTDPVGRVYLTLVEGDGRRTSAYSASDGTLRLLGLFAALRGPEAAQFYCFEELEHGIHPLRLYILLELIDQATSDGTMQIIATTHSPSLLTFLRAGTAAQEYAALVYRLEETPDAHIRRLLDIPDIQRVLEQDDLGLLHQSGWFEDVMGFDAARSAEAAA